MPGSAYEGSLFDSNGPMQFANQVRGIADALDQVIEKSTSFFNTTQSGLENLTQSLSDFQSTSGGFSPGGRRGGSGWMAGPPNSGGTGGQQGNTLGVGGSGNRPGDFESMSGGAPNGGYGGGVGSYEPMAGRAPNGGYGGGPGGGPPMSGGAPNGGYGGYGGIGTIGGNAVTRGVEAGIGVATGAAQNYMAQTEAPNIQQQLAAVQQALVAGNGFKSVMGTFSTNNMLGLSQADLSVGAATALNLFGTTMPGVPAPGQMGRNAGVLGGSINAIQRMLPTLGYTGAAQAMGGMQTGQAFRSQMQFLGGMTFRQGGAYQDPQQIVNRIFQLYPQLATMDNTSFEQTLTSGNLYQDLLNITGGDANMVEIVQNDIRATRNQTNRNPGGQLPSTLAGMEKVQPNLVSPTAVSALGRASATAHTQAGLAQGADTSTSLFNNAVKDFQRAVNDLLNGTGTGGLFGFAGGLLSHVGGAIGSLFGMGNAPGGFFGSGGLGGLFGGGGGGIGGGGGGGNVLDMLGAVWGVKGLYKMAKGMGRFLPSEAKSVVGGLSGEATAADIAGGAGADIAGGAAAAGAGEAGAATVGALSMGGPLLGGALVAGTALWSQIVSAKGKPTTGADVASDPAMAGLLKSGMSAADIAKMDTAGQLNFSSLSKLPSNAFSGIQNFGTLSNFASGSAQLTSASTGKNTSRGGTNPSPTQPSPNPVPTGTGGNVAAIVQQLAAAMYGWTGQQWTYINDLEMREAGWNLKAKNPSSKAYGIAQFINGPGEYYQYGGDPNTATGQGKGFLNYIKQRYGSPAAAWQHETAFGWYERGTYEVSRPTIAMLHKGERVIRSGDNTVSSRYGKEPTGENHRHYHYHISAGAIHVTVPGNDTSTLQQAGQMVSDALVAKLAKV